MEAVKSIEQISSLKSNKIIFKNHDSSVLNMNNATITFHGEGNVLYIDGPMTLSGNIAFEGSNSLAFLSQSDKPYRIKLILNNYCTAFIGKNCYFNNTVTAVLSESKNLWIGSDCLFSHGIFIRLADPHLVYDCKTYERLNPTESIFIGDHVWIGQDALILKGTKIGSGSIIGAKSLVSKKTIPSNTSWGGVPCKCIKEGVFYLGTCVHKWTSKETEKNMVNKTKEFTYEEDSSTVDFSQIDASLCSVKDPEKKLEYILKNNKDSKNRYFIPIAPKSDTGYPSYGEKKKRGFFRHSK